jgi:hypothetical protein
MKEAIFVKELYRWTYKMSNLSLTVNFALGNVNMRCREATFAIWASFGERYGGASKHHLHGYVVDDVLSLTTYGYYASY